MSIKESVSKTVEYAKGFNCSISKDEVAERLLGRDYYNREEIEKEVNRAEGVTNNKNVFWKNKLRLAKMMAKIISKNIKTIEFIGLTGSVAAKYPKKNDDIDFLIVTKKERMWISRLWLKCFLVAHKIPHRRQGKREEKDSLCFNLWLDDNNLAIPKERRSLKNAVDMMIMIPLFDRGNCYQKLLENNEWVKKFAKTPYENKKNFYLENPKKPNILGIAGKWINYFLFKGQYIYLKKKMINGEYVDIYQAFFNPKC